MARAKSEMTQPEMFALLLEQRELIIALTPYWEPGYAITLGRHPRELDDVNYYCTIALSEAKRNQNGDYEAEPAWSVSGGGISVTEAVLSAVRNAEAQIKKLQEDAERRRAIQESERRKQEMIRKVHGKWSEEIGDQA